MGLKTSTKAPKHHPQPTSPRQASPAVRADFPAHATKVHVGNLRTANPSRPASLPPSPRPEAGPSTRNGPEAGSSRPEAGPSRHGRLSSEASEAGPSRPSWAALRKSIASRAVFGTTGAAQGYLAQGAVSYGRGTPVSASRAVSGIGEVGVIGAIPTTDVGLSSRPSVTMAPTTPTSMAPITAVPELLRRLNRERNLLLLSASPVAASRCWEPWTLDPKPWTPNPGPQTVHPEP